MTWDDLSELNRWEAIQRIAEYYDVCDEPVAADLYLRAEEAYRSGGKPPTCPCGLCDLVRSALESRW